MSKIRLTEAQRFWLRMICTKLRAGEATTARELRIQLQDKLPPDFDPNLIDYRLLRGGDNITVLALALFDPTNERVNKANKVIASVFDLLNRFPNAEVISVDNIAPATNFSREDVAQIFRQLADISYFHTSGSTYGYGIDGWMTIRVDKKTFDAYLTYRNLSQVLDTLLDDQTLVSSSADENAQKFLQHIRKFNDELASIWIRAIDKQDLNQAINELGDWKRRVGEYLLEQLSDVEAVEGLTKGFPRISDVGDLDFRISRYETRLEGLAKLIEQNPTMLASTRHNETDHSDKKPGLEVGLEHAHSLYEKTKHLIEGTPNLNQTTARMIVESADDAIKEFGSKHQEQKVQLKEWKRQAERVLPPETIEDLKKRAESDLFKVFFPRNKWLRNTFVAIVAIILLILGLLAVRSSLSALVSKDSPSPAPSLVSSSSPLTISLKL